MYNLPLLAGMPAPALLALRDAASLFHLPNKAHAILDDAPFEQCVSFPLNGLFRIVAPISRQRRVPLDRFGRGDYFGDHPFLGMPKARNLEIYAERGGDIVCIDNTAFDQILIEHPSLLRAFTADIGRRLQAANERIYEAAALQARYRVAVALLRWSALGHSIGKTIILDPAPSEDDLAADIGISRHSAAIQLRALEKDGIIRQERLPNRLVIEDIGLLKRRIERHFQLRL